MSTLVQYVDNMKALGVAPTLLPSKPKPSVADPSQVNTTTTDPSDASSADSSNVVKNTAKHISDHVEDPMGSTKEMFEDLGDKQLAYEQSKAKARVALAPVKAVLQHVDQTHQLTPQQENMDESMGYHQPGDPNANQPQPMPGQQTMPKPGMGTTPQQMNMNRPSKVGVGKPGIAPGPQQSVRPAKMGMPQPGGGGGSPARPGQSAKPAAGGKKDNSRSIKVHIQGSSEYGDQELRSKLQEALREYYNGGDGAGDSPQVISGCGGMGKYPYIEDVFSKAKYIVYSLDGKKYKMSYTVSSKGGVTLTGKPAQVRIAYVEAKADKLSTIMAGVDIRTMNVRRGTE